MTKWNGTVVHVHVKKLQPRGHVHWRYRVPAAVSKSREYRPKNRIFFSNLIFFKKSKQIGLKLLYPNYQNRSKRIVNYFLEEFQIISTKDFWDSKIIYGKRYLSIVIQYLSIVYCIVALG